MAEKKKNKPVANADPNFFKQFIAFVTDERTVKIAGTFLLIVAVYLMASFTSHIFTYKTDMVIKDASWARIMMDSDLEVKNFMGKVGAKMSIYFMNQGFGIASFFIPFFLFVLGTRMAFHLYIISIDRVLLHGLFILIWLSFALGFLFKGFEHVDILYGSAGFFGALWLISLLGSVGAGLSLLFLAIAYMVLSFNIKYPDLSKQEELAPAIDEPAEEEMTENESSDSFDIDALFAGTRQTNPSVSELPKQVEFDVLKTSEEPLLVVELPEEEEEEKPVKQRVRKQKTEEVELVINETDEHDEDDDIEEEMPEEAPVRKHNTIDTLYDPRLELSSYQMPTTDLLIDHSQHNGVVSKEELEANKDRIVQTLKNFQVSIKRIQATIGPTVTLYEIVPEDGTRISRIKTLEDDIALSLAAKGIRIIAPIPGKGTIGIEVPNQKPEIVPMSIVLDSEKFIKANMQLPVALGKTISNEVFVSDLAKMPHLLIAGATGKGKSVGLNAIIASLLFQKHPSELKLVMIDPKKVELTQFSKIERHYLAKLPDVDKPIITDLKQVVRTLNSLCIEMDQRYSLLEIAGAKNIVEYNQKFINRKLNPNDGHKFLPYIVLVIDEFADMIIQLGKEVETPIARLAQLARAIGIHLIIATQRPSVNVITGTIKANFPTRISFQVMSKIDSRTILDQGGAERLIGRGDMLISFGSEMTRLQCPLIETEEIEQVVDFIGSQRGYSNAYLLPEVADEMAEGNGGDAFDSNDRDAMFEEAARVIVSSQQGSTSLLQRKLKLGYNRAGRIIDQLEAAGVVGPFEGSKAREVRIKDLVSLEQLLESLR